MTTLKAKGGLSTVFDWKTNLEPDFLQKLHDKGGLFTPLFLTNSKIKLPIPLIELFLEKCDPATGVFTVNGKTLSITLEDILYLTHLPIDGKPVLFKQSPSDEACKEVFGDTAAKKIMDLQRIAFNNENNERQRMVAVLKMIIGCFIMPSYNGYEICSTYVELLKDLDEVPKYAWGAALLAFLYRGLYLYYKDKKAGFDGNLWIVVAFFLVRMPGLWKIMGLTNLPEKTVTEPLLSWVIENVKKKCNDNKGSYVKAVKNYLDSVDDDHDTECVTWRPYVDCKLPSALQSQSDSYRFLRLGPIFNNNYVVHHRPDRSLLQFEIPNNHFDASKIPGLEDPIVFKDNRGQFGRNFEETYKKELDLYRKNIMLHEMAVQDEETNPAVDDAVIQSTETPAVDVQLEFPNNDQLHDPFTGSEFSGNTNRSEDDTESEEFHDHNVGSGGFTRASAAGTLVVGTGSTRRGPDPESSNDEGELLSPPPKQTESEEFHDHNVGSGSFTRASAAGTLVVGTGSTRRRPNPESSNDEGEPLSPPPKQMCINEFIAKVRANKPIGYTMTMRK